MEDIIKALITEAEVLEENAKFLSEHQTDLHSMADNHKQAALLRIVAHCKREAALRLRK